MKEYEISLVSILNLNFDLKKQNEDFHIKYMYYTKTTVVTYGLKVNMP